ncbi:interleukin-4 receptor subunit alpha isoform X2 [Chelonia mydas]|uniref:interleukin-4 receptor subunit alpha isoform X2 n=1 Tax=Chelonia mydas TaxID=8469 RepID=UPI0018A1E196|nr:interleukin-4 receptor subunit alpha isoform X2 [Chelonia mydas]XP_027681933.2 interleukin-4 receptor subunit alpha isoform X2 [Chelonia mydas]XP_027681934.2 interleukin-4 receptor subunit alpha isoform X2 [Chelonia mydas]XP_037766519.1 interleukin-4 receptor subunit alpha isoform X2 [Chelonia mydas]XP_037766520.1 interleukin-4 receptor subunit alpha isoform X2 [Chelonia mydas]XP_037766521.1 interleukin-4 receptor subunit alpha isoform X2 [Chelonia mydas]XP_037766522.1 interleukin-4 recept
MADSLKAAVLALWTLFFSCATYHIMATGRIQRFECFTDYARELSCHWEAAAQTNCSKEFRLYYKKEILSTVYNTCIPETGKGSSMNSVSNCICIILPEYFTAGLAYHLALQANGTVLWNDTVEVAYIVKPRPPTNLTIEKGENGNFYVLRWIESYSAADMLYGEQVIYEVKYWNKQNPEEEFVEQLPYQTTHFEIRATQLKQGYDYLVRVRRNYTGSYSTNWSDWSNAVEFHSDYGVTLEDSLQRIVLISCMLITALILICYFCFAIVKREWWDQIPNPAKSHLVVKNVKGAQISVWRKMLSTDEIKAPFYDVKQTHMEHQLSCKNCLAKYAQGQTLKGKDNVKSGEKPGSCLNKCGEWFPEEYEAVLIPEITLIEDSLEICEFSRNTETENHEDNLGEILLCPPCESSANSFIEHTQHNDALADMFIKLLECGTSIHDTEIPDFIIEEQKTFENCESENSSQQTPKENVVQDQQSGDTSHACSFSTTASQDDYNCRAASTKSVQSEESFESGYQSSNIDTASPEAKNPPDMLHQRHFLCSSETQHDLLVLIKKSPNAPSSEIIKDGINTPAYQSFDSLMSQSTEPCSTAYKSFDSLMSQSTEPCSTAYKSFDSLLSQSTESCSTAYKSFASLLSQSTVSNSLTQCLENPSSSLSLAEFPENQILPYREEQAHQPLGDQSCYTNHKGDCTETAFQTICSEDIDFPWFFSHAHDKVSFFLPEKEIHKQITCQHVPEKAAAISCPSVSNPSSYQPFGIALKDNNTHCDNNSEAISESPYKPFINLLNNNLKETLPAITVCESDLEINLSDFL